MEGGAVTPIASYLIIFKALKLVFEAPQNMVLGSFPFNLLSCTTVTADFSLVLFS